MAGTKGSSEPGRSAEPAKAAGIAPWSSRKGSGQGLRPEAVTRTGSRRSFGRERGPGKRQGLRAAPRSKATGGASAPMRAWRRCGFGRAGSAQGDGGGASALPPRPTGDRTGLRGLAAVPGESGRSVRAPPRSQSRPARDGRATQRRQSRLGQVGAGGDTGPHYDSGSWPQTRFPEAARHLDRASFCVMMQPRGGSASCS
jgi:hypothetical protein